MEKLIIGASFTFGLLIAIPSMADTGKSCDSPGSCNYTPQSNAGSGIGSSPAGALPPGWTPGGGMGGGPSAQDLQAKRRAEEEGIRAGCRSNRASILDRYNRCIADITLKWSTQAGNCPIETEIVVDAGIAKVVTTPLKTCTEQLDRQLKSDTLVCGQQTGLATCQAYGAF